VTRKADWYEDDAIAVLAVDNYMLKDVPDVILHILQKVMLLLQK